ncbi:MAG: universal stress protein [Tannerella sp.]|jgi:nucleotide-binding universal stress UspA family protein|nr:universal stress protein [Tannerella sp.]
MEEKLVTLAIHTFEKAQILKTILESEGIEAYIHNVNLIQAVVSAGVRVRIKESDLPRALRIIEATQFFKDESESPVDENVKKVLIPIDFSDYSVKACEIGFRYAGRIGAEIRLIHAYYAAFIPPSLPYLGIGQESSVYDESIHTVYRRVQTDMSHIISVIDKKTASGELPEVKYDCIFREGLPEDEIIAYTKEYRPTMIVMGTRGKNRKNIDLIGSVTAEIIESSRVPLLAIPENVPFSDIREAKNVAFAISFNQQDLVAFDRFADLMKGIIPKVHLFNISTSRDEWNEIRLTGTREYLRKHYPGLEIEFTVLDNGDLLDAVEKFVREKNIDIITLTTHRRRMITRIFNPSIARKMLFHTNTALLVIPKG